MASSVFFKFKSQKEPTRVEFDGTGISVFELKREIILRSGLGDGTDFDLVITADDAMKEVYDDDTTIIPRSTTVIARRMPPKVAGRGGAARYVSGKMPVHAKNSSRKEQIAKPLIKSSAAPVVQLSSAMTEEEKMAAVFQAQTEHFTSREEEMATYVLPLHSSPCNKVLTKLYRQQYVAKSGAKKPANVPDHEPPQGYICYRCGEKGHWIQLCPTNDNPEYDNRPRVKRTTGIPKSFLKTVDKATALGQNADGDDTKPAGIMVDENGDFVIAEPDKAAWEQFQAKAKSNAAAQKAAPEGDKEVQERGLECPIDKKMFIDPMKTPCCEKTYCNDCITNALIESDFVCPSCKTDGVLIDDLKADEEAVERMKAYLAEKDSKAKEGSKSPKGSKSPPKGTSEAAANKPAAKKQGSKSPTPAAASVGGAQNKQQPSTSNNTPKSTTSTPVNGETKPGQVSKKRPAEDIAENPKIPKAPKAMQKVQEPSNMMDPAMMMNGMGGMNPMNGMGGMNGMGPGGMPMMFPGMPMMPGNFGPGPGGMGMGGMNMGMNPMMNGMMNSMMGGAFPGPQGMNGNGGMWGGPGDISMGMGPGMMGGMGPGMGPGGGGMNMGGGGPMNGGVPPHMNGGMNGHGGPTMNGMNGGGFNHQHRNNQQGGQMGFHPNHRNFTNQPADDEDAYFRKPVNPHRHQNRQRRVRPSDYREL
ncbi:DWNN domain containing protein [Naviculisporaceae sp. PSN 640]